MPNTIDLSFIKQFESDVHLAYQRFGSKLLNTIRRKMNVRGVSTTFQKVGKGTASKKARNGEVVVNNLPHTPGEIILEDWYAAEWLDKLDELKINHDERMVQARSLAAALGRKSDELIVDAIAAGANATAAAGALTLPKIEEAFEWFGNNDVPDDGMRYMAVSPQGWTDLMALPQFSSADYVSTDALPYPMMGSTAKRWFSFLVFTFSGLPINAGVRESVAYHGSALGGASGQEALGGASGQEVMLDVTWQGLQQSWLTVASMSQGAGIIDDTGVYRLRHTET